MQRTENHFTNAKSEGITQQIDLRFFERICTDSVASERGVYKFTLNPGAENERNFFGQFHVLLRIEEGKWRIIMDYDSSENETINEESFLKAHAMDDYDKFIDL
jgi:hypothetical protein